MALLLAALAGSQLASAGDTEVISRVIASIDAGQFKAAEATISAALAQPDLDDKTRDTLLFQRVRMRRILIDFSLDADAVMARLRERIPDLTDTEFARWDARGLLEHQVIDGNLLYFNRSPSNLFRLSAEARACPLIPRSNTFAPKPSIRNEGKPSGTAAICISISGITSSKQSCCRYLPTPTDNRMKI